MRLLNSNADGGLLPGVAADGRDIVLDIGIGEVEPAVEGVLLVAENTAVVSGREVLLSVQDDSNELVLPCTSGMICWYRDRPIWETRSETTCFPNKWEKKINSFPSPESRAGCLRR